jgi:hypothetical protein
VQADGLVTYSSRVQERSMADELVVRVVLKDGYSRDQYADAITAALSLNPGVKMAIVDLGETGAAAEETRPITMSGGLQLEETRRLYVRFGPRPDERVQLARQQFSMLGMLLNTPTVRGTKKLMERLREWDPYTWNESSEGSATKVYSRLRENLDQLARRLGRFDSGLYRLVGTKGVYGWLGVVRESRRKR